MFQYHDGFEKIVIFGRLLYICRIYRLYSFFEDINERKRTCRRRLYFLEHFATVLLVLHASTCLWYNLHTHAATVYHYKNVTLGYPKPNTSKKIFFNSYLSCWYYCSCRFFNVIFGDTFPLSSYEKWLTTALSFIGYVFMRYRFIGTLVWEFVLKDKRRSCFMEKYQHMTNYLKFRGAPTELIEQIKKYQTQIWEIKDGVLRSDLLKKIPISLQMELIFDLNVGHFHDSILFRDTDEAFMRQISLLMRHELFLAGQTIWSQGVVKSGMICVKRGVLEILSDEDDESPMIAFKEGTVLGELSLFYSIPAKVTVKAATYVEVQVLRRTEFMRVIAEYPNTLQHIRERIQDRLHKSRKRQEAITRNDKGDLRLLRTRYRPMKVLKDTLTGVEDEDSAFVDDSHMYFTDEDNIRKPKFTTEYLELYKITNNVTTVDYPRICLRSNFPWILEPDTSFTLFWDMIHFMTVLYVCVTCPRAAIEGKQSDSEIVVSFIVTAALLLNIFLQLTTAIVVKNKRKITIKEIAEAKMGSIGFYIDIISVFPVYIFTDTIDPNGVSVTGQIALLFPILQVWHIWNYMEKWKNNLKSHHKILSLLRFTIVFVIFSYWSGCLLYIFACPRKLCRESSWMCKLINLETKVFMKNFSKHEQPILTALSFGTSIFTGSGTYDLTPGTSDLPLVAMIFIFGTYLSCYYTANICSVYMLSTSRQLNFRESMRELFYFLTANRVNQRIKARVKNFFCVQWSYNKAIPTQKIFNEMSSNIQQEILCIEMVDTLLQCPLFQGCNRDFLQTIAANTRTIVLPDNEIVQHAADIGRDMYILQKGYCDVLNHDRKIEKNIGPGDHFGVVEMLYGLPKVHTVLTSTNCILLHVEYTALVQCLGTFPDISYPIITLQEDVDLLSKAKCFEEAKPLIGRLDVKINRIAREIKESFVVLNEPDTRAHYLEIFKKLGVMRHLRYIFLPICITPHGIFLKFWCTIRFISAVIYIIAIPYSIAVKHYQHHQCFYYTDIVLYLDVIVMAYVAYYNERSLLVTHPLYTVRKYLKGAFLWDLLSIFPFEYLVKIITDTNDLDIYRINRILLVTRLTSAFSYWESDLMQVNPVVVLLKFLPIAVTLVNFVAALIFKYSCVPYLPAGTNKIMVNCTKVMSIVNLKTESKYALSEYSNVFYWVFEIFVGLGCTPVSIGHSVNVWLMMGLQIAGFLYFAFMFGYVSSTGSAAAHALLEHTEKIRDLADFLYQANVDSTLMVKTLKYFEYVWKRTNGSNPQQICRRLNSSLMEDTLVFMYEGALREVPLFGKVERSFIRLITQHVHEMYFLKGDTVIQCKDIQSYIFIIYRGKVDVLTSYNEMITCMGPGGMFGNFTGKPMACSEVTIYASRSLDLLVIPSHTFFNLVKYYPKIQQPLNKAFERSRDYILPITMDTQDDSSSDDTDHGLQSQESVVDSKSESIRYDVGFLTVRNSQSNVSQALSSASIATYLSYAHISNVFRPGTLLFLTYGYLTCFMAAATYLLGLYEVVTFNDCPHIFWIQAFLDVFFYIRMFVSMHQGYINKHGELIIDSLKCRRRYYSHKLRAFTDALVNFPLELFCFCFPYPMKALHYLRINRLLRLKYLIEFYKRTAAELTNNLTTLQSTMTMIAVFLLIHTFTCIWLVTLILFSSIYTIRTVKSHLMDEDLTKGRWDYITSLYMVVSSLTTTGGDELIVDDVYSMFILGILLIGGKMLAAVVVMNSIQVAYSSKYALNCYETATDELVDVLKNQGLSSYQLKKLWMYVQQLWVAERGRQLPVLLAQTPYVRRCDLMSAMFGHHLRNCYLFAETGESFLRQLTVALEYAIYFPGNYIVVAGDCEARMHWVNTGVVSVVSVRNDLTETTHERLTSGDVFGVLQGLSRGVTHGFSYKAETKVSILSLSLDAWTKIIQFFPESKRIVSERTGFLFAQL
ncbi:uncharacterized protein LOC101746849 [Bombyx mori]